MQKSQKLVPIQELMSKEVDRKDFLKIVGFGAVTAVGLAPVIHFLTGKGYSKVLSSTSKKQTSGYGSSAYGV